MQSFARLVRRPEVLLTKDARQQEESPPSPSHVYCHPTKAACAQTGQHQLCKTQLLEKAVFQHLLVVTADTARSSNRSVQSHRGNTTFKENPAYYVSSH